jgi:hypothetical protein
MRKPLPIEPEPVVTAPGLTPERQAFQDRLTAEASRQAAGGVPCVYYEPTYGANGHLQGGKFLPHGVPSGFELDVTAWEQAGKQGAAPLKEVTDGR